MKIFPRIGRFSQGLLLMVVVISACAARSPGGQGDGWVQHGQREVSDRLDHDVIPVTIARGDFRRIKLTVHRASVDFRRVVVRFRNGGDQTVQLRNTIPAGGETRAIDLTGGERVIRNVEFWYDANTRGRRAVVRLWGHR